MKKNVINVAKPSLPSKKHFLKYLDEIYKTHHLTNNGPLVKKLKKKLEKRLNVKNLLLVNNATIGLEVAIKTFNPQKKIATTPFTYISTLNAIRWLGLKEKFFDIDSKNLNIDYKKLNNKTLHDCSGILATHAFGNICNIDRLEKIAKKNKKFLIFDAAHCFDLEYKKKSVLSFGDASVISFQATKFFNTCEGGAIVFKKKSDYQRAKKLTQIGYDYEKKNLVPSEGTNAKMSDLTAAWGLSLLNRLDIIKKKREAIYNLYKKNLSDKLNHPIDQKKKNFLYFPILFNNINQLKKCMNNLNKSKIFPRRYFFPSLNTVSNKKNKMVISEKISKRILCLPMHEYLTSLEVKKIINITNASID
jgi:dTDP-4-amino-4,6-dideoxygalactose transaminase